MAKFLLKNGPHYVPGRKEPYVPGDVIESDSPLDELFRNKFERISGTTAPRVSEPEPPELPAVPSIPEEPQEEEKEPDCKFKIVTISRGKFDVVKISTGEKINDEPLTEEQAFKIAGENAVVEKASRRKKK